MATAELTPGLPSDATLRRIARLAEAHGWAWHPTDSAVDARILEVKQEPDGQGVFFSVVGDRCRAEIPFIDQLAPPEVYFSPAAVLSQLLDGSDEPNVDLQDNWQTNKLNLLEIIAAINFNSLSSARLGVDPEDGEVRAQAQVKMGVEGLRDEEFEHLLADLYRVTQLFQELKGQLALRAWTSSQGDGPVLIH